jgi:hypothetical protein
MVRSGVYVVGGVLLAGYLASAVSDGVGAQPAPPPSSSAPAGRLVNGAFQIEHDASGIRSVKRTNDVYDTEYIAANGALGRLLVRYRGTTPGEWRELRELLPRPAPSAGAIEYALGEMPPPLTSRISPAAERGVGGLRALNDGLVPSAQRSGGTVPSFVWTTEPNEPGGGGPGVAGTTRWVQYTFPTEEEVGRIEVFWLDPPQRWRLVYQDDLA